MTRFVDFDAAFAEQDRDPLIIRLFGADWSLPSSLPAAAVLRVARLMASGKAEADFTQGELLTLSSELIPADILDQWLAKGVDVDQLAEIIKVVMASYMGEMRGDDAPGEVPAPT